jgi:hypothetical protein
MPTLQKRSPHVIGVYMSCVRQQLSAARPTIVPYVPNLPLCRRSPRQTASEIWWKLAYLLYAAYQARDLERGYVMSATPDTVVGTVLDQVDHDLDQSCQRLFSLLRIPGISTQPEHGPDVQQAAAWLSDQLADLGFEVAVRPTAGHPVVLGHHPGPSGTQAPRILSYGHNDVQPPDPLELWTSPPYDPQIVEGPHGARVVREGRRRQGTVDDVRRGTPRLVGGGIPVPVSMLLEGEEEIGDAIARTTVGQVGGQSMTGGCQPL